MRKLNYLQAVLAIPVLMMTSCGINPPDKPSDQDKDEVVDPANEDLPPVDTTTNTVDTTVVDNPVNPPEPVVVDTFAFVSGKFSVANDRQVLFSRGNLQFRPAMGSHMCADGTTQPGTWRFAEYQWKYTGYTNERINDDNPDFWLDLFGWGTSGYNEVYPYLWTLDYSAYPSAADEYYDWGAYNTIGEDAPGTWRTLTSDEWVYLLSHHMVAQATLRDTRGLVIFPDDWEFIEGMDFRVGDNVGYTANIINTSAEWAEYESRGAVFLPAAGHRHSAAWESAPVGMYWTLTSYNYQSAQGVGFNSSTIESSGLTPKPYGLSVRLVQDVQ